MEAKAVSTEANAETLLLLRDVLAVLAHNAQPNRDTLRAILMKNMKGKNADKYKTSIDLIGKEHKVSAARLSGILDLLFLLGLIGYYKESKLLVLTDLGEDIRKALEKGLNLPKILRVGAKELDQKTSNK